MFAAPSAVWAYDCKDIAAQRQHFNFGELAGPHRVHWNTTIDDDAVQRNFTFTLDLCQNLQRHKGGSDATECPVGTRVCGIREDTPLDTMNSTYHVIPIAGTYKAHKGSAIDAKFTLLRNSKSNSDASREGVRAELHGGVFPFNPIKGVKSIKQKAIVEFVCDKDRTGLEKDEKDNGEMEDAPEGEESQARRMKRAEDSCEDSDKSLRFCGYQKEKDDKGNDVQVLRLDWRTKYACEDTPSPESQSWGFFTWFIIV